MRKRVLLWGILGFFILSASAYALPFKGSAVVGQHIYEGSLTDEFYLVIDDMGPFSKASLKGFKFLKNSTPMDFSELGLGDEPAFYQINVKKTKLFRKLAKKARKRGLEGEDQDAWIASQLGAKTFKLILKGDDGKKYKAMINFAQFNNPPVEVPPQDENPASVPEPATMLLLGTGLLGLAAMRRRFK